MLLRHGRFLGLFLIGLMTLMQACGGDGSSDDSATITPKYAPSESPRKTAYFSYAIPPTGFTAVVGWMMAIDIQGKGISSKVEVDWMRLHAVVDGNDMILYEDNFDALAPAMNNFGLYIRNPWFDGNQHTAMPFTIENSRLVIEPSRYPQKVFHWWNTSRSIVPKGTSRVWFEASIRITGGAGVQAGIDYWKNLTVDWAGYNVNNIEAGVSDWFGNSTNDWQIISVGRP